MIRALFILCLAIQDIDFEKARALMKKQRDGGTLTAEEKAYLQKAMEARKKGNAPAPAGKETLGLKPLSEMSATDKYKDQDGGLYGEGKNEPPKEHLQAALAEASKIKPVDGKIVLISVGMSNTTQEFSRFMQIARNEAPQVTIVDGAQGGQTAKAWADTDRPWAELEKRLQQAQVTAAQVQVAWIKQANAGPAQQGEFPKHAEILKNNIATLLQKLKEKFPNLKLAYLSSRIYAGYASTPLNPEPYAYESAFAVRWLIQDQIKGGAIKSPILLWGPYLWGDGTTPRKDGLVWKAEDLGGDGTHPSNSGRDKVAQELLKFFKTDPTAKVWFGREK